jgi:alpha-mannosidase
MHLNSNAPAGLLPWNSQARARSGVIWLIAFSVAANTLGAAWFIDGYHGGVYGHYPSGYTAFIVEQLKNNPGWRINLEIEPETWDSVRIHEPQAYAEFKKLMEDQSNGGRIEIVNPCYGQSYLFQASGESVVRQLDYGMRKLREHFPGAVFTSYSSEEPCFTSCLPPVLKSFGFKFASLKNPDTCWGGYASAHGGELVNWIGHDGSSILAVPRYACETLQPNSCWQTIACHNSPQYLEVCRNQGIDHPVGMCLQDAGWRGGPWLGKPDNDSADSSKYITWRDYVANVTPGKTEDDWHFSQEDVKPGLMWGAQVLQRIAQQSREAEHRLLVAEKLAAMALVDAGLPVPTNAFDEAWKDVLLTQHHDCWIVPYNGRIGNTWADQVHRWTTNANAISDLAMQTSLGALLKGEGGPGGRFVRLFNPTAAPVDAVVSVPNPTTESSSQGICVDAAGHHFATQIVYSSVPEPSTLLVRAKVPPMGFATVELHDTGTPDEPPVTVTGSNGILVMESDLYRIEFDPKHGGTIRSLVAKKLGNREFVDIAQERRFNELRGNFYEEGGFRSSADGPATVNVRESGPLRATVEISGVLAGSPFLQRVSVSQGSPVIDCFVRIEWKGNPRIGEFEEKDGFRNRRRPAYDDRFKLLALFPVKASDQRIAKDAPYDVCESKLQDTFFNTWENLKNNVLLNWVDVSDGAGDRGLALFTDHTTSYAHGPAFPLGLTIQYGGKGLWGRDYRVEGPTQVRYALMPHAGRWDTARVSSAAMNWLEPVVASSPRGGRVGARTLIDPGNSGWEVPAMFERDGALLVRLFNASGDATPQPLGIGFDARKIELVELDGRLIQELKPEAGEDGKRTVSLGIPRFGIRTLRFTGLMAPR